MHPCGAGCTSAYETWCSVKPPGCSSTRCVNSLPAASATVASICLPSIANLRSGLGDEVFEFRVQRIDVVGRAMLQVTLGGSVCRSPQERRQTENRSAVHTPCGTDRRPAPCAVCPISNLSSAPFFSRQDWSAGQRVHGPRSCWTNVLRDPQDICPAGGRLSWPSVSGTHLATVNSATGQRIHRAATMMVSGTGWQFFHLIGNPSSRESP